MKTITTDPGPHSLRPSILARAALLAVLLIFVSAAAQGASFTVTKTADTNDGVCDADCSFREAIQASNNASSDDEILFSPIVFSTTQTIFSAFGHAIIDGNLQIVGPGSGLLTIDGSYLERLLTIRNGATVTISGITLAKGGSGGTGTGRGGGALRIESGTVTINNSVITSSGALGGSLGAEGGGIYNAGTLSLNNTTVSANRANVDAGDDGGGIYNASGASLSINNSTITGNAADAGGGIFNRENVTTTLAQSTISANTAIESAGIYNTNGPLSVTNSEFSSNLASSQSFSAGGAIRHNLGILSITSSTFTGNSAGSGGGLVTGGTATISDATFSNNSAANGNGGGLTNSGSLTISSSTFANNSTATVTSFGAGNGGAIFNGGALSASRLVIRNNTATNGGGGVGNNVGTASIDGSTITNNQAGTGGGFCNACGITGAAGSVMNVTNSTVTNNTATMAPGGGFHSTNFSTVNLLHVTLIGNTAARAGGGFNTSMGTVNARSTLIADNIATGGIAPDFEGTLVSQGYNLIENPSGTTITGTLTGNILNRDPMLMPLGDYGGETETISLLPVSPAVDAADPVSFPLTDQRGIARPQDGDLNGASVPDIGAYERKVTTFTVTKIADTADGVCDSDCSLREAVQTANLSEEPDNAVTFDPSFGVPRTIVLTGGELVVDNGGTYLIHGPGSGLLTISGNNVSRVLFVNTGANATLSGATVSGGNAVGAIDSGHGGGIRVFNGSRFILNNAVVANNRASSLSVSSVGGGIAMSNGILIVINSVVRNNSTSTNAGGGINQFAGSVTIINSTIRNNDAGGDGGGLANFVGGALSVFGSTIADNSANDGGGIAGSGTFVMANSTVSGNIADDRAGGIDLINCTASITNSTISGNSAAFGSGGIGGANLTLLLTNVTIAFNDGDSDNNGSGNGGGIGGGAVTARNVIIANNQAATSPDLAGLNSQGYNLIGNATGVTITGTTTGNILNHDPFLLPLRNYGGSTLTHALKPNSPAVDKGAAATPPLSLDQRGLTRPFDFASIPNAPGGNGSDIGAFERQSTDTFGTAPFDFDGDGKTDLGVFRPLVAEWWINRSSDGNTFATQFGSATDKIVPADYTGDGKSDVAVWRPSTGEWFVLRSEDFSFFAFPFGTNGDSPAPADYDGDGKSDPAVFRSSSATWFVRRSSDNGTTIEAFGENGDAPVPADYDGDGKADLAIFRPSVGQWWIKRSMAGVIATTFGDSNDKPVAGDYTGDGKSDIAFWRPSTGEWFVLRSEDFSFFAFPFGTTGDIPSPGDYDGDGRHDATVFRSSSATWYSQRSTAGTLIQQFGATGDRPIPNAFVP